MYHMQGSGARSGHQHLPDCGASSGPLFQPHSRRHFDDGYANAFDTERGLSRTLRGNETGLILTVASSLEKEPGPFLRFVDPDFDQARSGDISAFVA